jgi:DNA primase
MFQKGLGIYNQDNLLCDRNTQEHIKKSGLIVVEGLFDGASFIEAGSFNGGALMGMQISMMQIALLKFIDAHVKIIKVFFDRNVPGGGGVQKALSLPENNGFQVDIFIWHQIVCHSHASPVKLPEQMKDTGDMSAKQLQWLREN